MNLLAAFASLLGIETEIVITRAKESAVAYALIGLLGVIALSFALVATYNWLYAWIGPIWGPLAIAGAALVIALIVFIALRIQQQALAEREAERKRARQRKALITTAAVDLLPALMDSGLFRNVGVPIGVLAALLVLGKASGTRSESANSDE